MRGFFSALHFSEASWGSNASPATNSPHRVSEIFRGPALQKIAGCSRFQRSPQISRTRVPQAADSGRLLSVRAMNLVAASSVVLGAPEN